MHSYDIMKIRHVYLMADIHTPGTTVDSSSGAKAKSGLAAVKAAVRQSDDMFTDMFGEKCLVSIDNIDSFHAMVKPYILNHTSYRYIECQLQYYLCRLLCLIHTD